MYLEQYYQHLQLLSSDSVLEVDQVQKIVGYLFSERWSMEILNLNNLLNSLRATSHFNAIAKHAQNARSHFSAK